MKYNVEYMPNLTIIKALLLCKQYKFYENVMTHTILLLSVYLSIAIRSLLFQFNSFLKYL